MSREMFNYQETTQMIDDALKVAGPIPCSMGKGVCCDRTVPTTKGDRDRIIDAIKTGKISEGVKVRAINRSRDFDSDRCPFLGDSNECTIYAERPLVCRSFGVAGEVRSDRVHEFIEATDLFNETGIETQIPLTSIECAACLECQPEIIASRRSFPLRVVTATTVVSGFILQERMAKRVAYLHDFIRRDLKKYRKNK